MGMVSQMGGEKGGGSGFLFFIFWMCLGQVIFDRNV